MQYKDADTLNIFFSLLRSGLYGTPIPEAELPEAIDWPAVLNFADKQAVLGLIIDSVQLLPERLHPSPSTAAKISKKALKIIQANLIMDKTAARLVTLLNKEDIHGVLLKGQGVARYYRIPQMRQSGDVDFYVGNTIYKYASKICRDKLADDKDACEENEQHFNFDLAGAPIELHRIASRMYSPFRKKRFQAWTVEQLERSHNRRTLIIENTQITVPSYDFDAIYIFYHAWRHFIMGGIGFRQLCDWAMIFHNHADDIDTAKLVENIRSFGITKGWKLFGCIVVKYLGLAPEKMPLYDPSYQKKSEKILEDIIAGGNFGFHSKANSGAWTQKQKYGLNYGLHKVRNITKYFFALVTLIPVEATFLFFNRLYTGTIACTKRARRSKK